MNSAFLPGKQQTTFYLLFLIASPLVNLLVNSLVYEDFHREALRGIHRFSLLHWFLESSGFLLGLLLVLLGLNLIQTYHQHHRASRRSLLIFGLYSTLYFLLNLLTVTYGIFAFKVQSLFLLLITSCTYVSMNIIFLFWYWYVDYPSQVRHLSHSHLPTELVFPTENSSPNQLPSFIDYLYFTILSSNTLGPPENHSASGEKAKLLLLTHSTIMLILLVVFISRAINTLA
mgnify:CR=1